MTHVNRWTALECAAVLVLAIAFQQSVRAQDAGAAVSANPAATGAAAAESQTANGSVPRLIKFSGVVTNADGKPATGAVPLTFTLYNAQEEGANLWTETQSVQLDAQGRYTVLLGAASTAGLPLDLFASGSALWLGVQPDLAGAGEQPRVLLVAVPYALKAADADTLGGKPASAYVLSEGQIGASATSAAASTASASGGPISAAQKAGPQTASKDASPLSAVAGAGIKDTIPIWTASQKLGNSIMFQALDRVGVGTKTPGARIDAVSPDIAVRGTAFGKNGNGVFGNATATSGNTNGVFGQTASPTGNGVAGNSTAPSGYTAGVYGQASSVNGTGVYGQAVSWVGVGGTATGPNGTGVNGISAATSGSGNGVFGQSASTSGTGVGGSVYTTSGYTNGVYGSVASPNGTGVVGVNNSSAGGTAVVGVANATSGNATGVSGTIASTSGAGVSGVATGTSGYNNGVYGQTYSTQGYGVNGNAVATSGYNVGVYGQTESTSGYGVFGSANATGSSGAGGIGVIGINLGSNGSAGSFGALAGQGLILQGWGSNFTQVFSVDASGNLDISGNLTVAGSKSARVKMQDGREVALYAVESPENWFEDFGTAQLQGGAAAVSFETGFLQTVDTAASYHVFLTPNGDCRGLYVTGKTPAGFEVRELGGGNASIAFDYRIVAHRRGFENARLQDVHLPQGPKDMQARFASMRSGDRMVAPQPPKITIPVVPHAPAPAH
ncbi:MAG TPA: hypothetical protein VKO18_07985 [Terriglobia bacterium]|nr:hypothetical protein [Terriglobia bacterium]